MTNKEKNNLWEILEFNDLKYLLVNAKKRYLVLAIITSDTESDIRKMIRHFLKKKSKIYSKVTFLYYEAKKEDFGQLKPMFAKDISKYPKMIHIWNVEDIMTQVFSIDNEEIMNESFEDYHDFYVDGTPPPDFSDDETEENIINHKENIINHKDDQNNTNKQEKSPDEMQKQQKIHQQQMVQHKPPSVQPIANNKREYLDPELEKKRMIEKIQILRQTQNDCFDIFMTEVKKRKRDEENKERGNSTNKDKKKK